MRTFPVVVRVVMLLVMATAIGCDSARVADGGSGVGVGVGVGGHRAPPVQTPADSVSDGAVDSEAVQDTEAGLPSEDSTDAANPSEGSDSHPPPVVQVDLADDAQASPPDLPMPTPLPTADAGQDQDDSARAPDCSGPGAQFATDIVAYQFGSGQNFGQDRFPANVFGPPMGGGCCAGSLDVVSLGDGGSVTVAFAGNAVADGPGPDFIVFENAFDLAGNSMNRFTELGVVEVSQDGVNWVGFPCTAVAYPFVGCAGWHPVFANPNQNQIDPTDPMLAGGDAFDLAEVGLSWARYVRITDRPGDSAAFDLDAVAVVNSVCD